MVHKKGIQLSGIFIYTALSLLFIITFYPFWNIFVLSLNDATVIGCLIRLSARRADALAAGVLH